MKELLSRLKSAKFVGVAELCSQAATVLENSDTYQEKGTVTAYPDERTIRYYISEGLIPPVTEKQGPASVFSYEHLLALLAVKKLQAQNLPIKKIREILAGKQVDELERLLGVDEPNNDDAGGAAGAGGGGGDGKNEAQLYLESLLLPKSSERFDSQQLRSGTPAPAPPAPMMPPAAARSSQPPPFAPPDFSSAPPGSSSQSGQSSAGQSKTAAQSKSWERFEIEEGLELHVEKNFKTASDSQKRRSLMKIIEEIIQLLGKR